MDLETINVADLKLDGLNPRHDPVKAQRDVVEALLAKEGSKIVKLAEDIATNGLSPIEAFLVLHEPGGSYTVLEGNRRLATVKLMANPTLTKVPKFQARFRALKKRMPAPITDVSCAIVANRDDAKHWQLLRHHGQSEGRGVVPWDTEASARFFGRRGTQAEKALSVLDAVKPIYVKNAPLLKDLDDVRRNKLTTFGRLVGDPFVRQRLGLELKPTVGGHYSSEDLEPAFARILSDLSTGKVTVSALKSQVQRRTYILGLGADLPDETKYEADARPLVPPGMPRPPAPKPKTKPTPSPAPPKPLFDGVRLTNLGSKIAAVLTELQQMDVDRFPNACAVLTRVVIDLAVTEVHEKKGWSIGSLKDLVKKCVYEIDRTQTDAKYQAVRTGLNDGTSMFAVKTIHAYLHNQHFSATPSEVRSIAANYSPFLSALDGLV